MIDITLVKDAVTEACWDQLHRCNGLICGCPCHDQDRARVSEVLGEEFRNLPPIGKIDGAEIVRLIFGPAVMAGNIAAAATQGDLILIEVERRVREQVAQEIERTSFQLTLGTMPEVLAGARAARTTLAQCAKIAREGNKQ